MDIFDNPSLALKKIGTVGPKSSLEIEKSAFSVGFECLDRKVFNPDKCYDKVAELGVKYARCQTGWIRCETEKGKYSFEWLDEVVDNLLERGVQPLFNLTYGNPLYMPGIPHQTAVGCSPTGFGEECLEAWRNYVKALADHFQGRIHHWEIWNEPDIALFWYPLQASGENYAELVGIASKIIREIDSEAVLVGCVAHQQGPFVLEALKHGIGEFLDCFSVHPYDIIPEKNYFHRIRHLERLFRIYAPHVKIWQAECGYPSQAYGHKDMGSLPLYNGNETTQAKYVLRRLLLDSELGLEVISYFHISDLTVGEYRMSDGGLQPPTLLGLLKTQDYVPKKAFYAMKNMTPIFDCDCNSETLELEMSVKSFSLESQGALPELGIHRSTFIRKGYPVYCWYLAEDLQKEWFGTAGVTVSVLTETQQSLSQPVLIDPLNGTVYKVEDVENKEFGAMSFKNLPLTDYPLLLTDARAIEIK